jgi:hypothetical protein
MVVWELESKAVVWWEKQLGQGDANKDQRKERGGRKGGVMFCTTLLLIPHYGTMMSSGHV